MKTNTIRNTFALLALTSTLTGLPGISYAADTKTQSVSAHSSTPVRMRLLIAVDQMKIEETKSDVDRLPADVREGLQSLLIQKLLASGYFNVVERANDGVEAAKQEDAYDRAHRASEPNGDATRRQREIRVAASYIITPTVIGYTVHTPFVCTGFGTPPFFYTRNRRQTATLTLNIRISDAQTGEIIASEVEYGTHTAKSNGIIFRSGCYDLTSNKYEESASGKAIDEALEKSVKLICNKLDGVKWTAKVVKQDENTKRVILNAGSSSGLQEGMELVIFHRSAGTVNPGDGHLIPGDEVEAGRIRVERIEGDYSFAKPLSTGSFKTGDIVRLANETASR